MNKHEKFNRMKMTYIGQLIADGTGVGGGARLKGMVSIFERIGIEINLISFSFYSDKFFIENRRINDSLQITTVHIPKNIPRVLKAFAILPVFVCAWRSSKSCNIIFSDFITEIAYIPAIIIGKLTNKPIILDCIDTKFFKIIPDSVNKYAAKNADLVFAISYYLLETIKKKYGCKNGMYLPIFIDTNRFKLDKKIREEKRTSLDLKKDDIVIGYVGSFDYYEGIPLLLQAFRNLKNKHSRIKLAIMGKSYSKGGVDILRLVDDMNLMKDVLLIQSKPYEQVPNFLSTFDILCCPKIDCEINRAANPVKVVEYLSMGIPAVCSAVGGIIDMIDHGVNGLLVKPGDVKDLEEKLEWIILNPERAKEIGENGRKTAIEIYSLEAIENTIREAIYEIVDRKKRNKKGD